MKIIQKTLPNGLRLVMAPQADAVTATVLVLVGTGSEYETKKEHGLSHFLEHMYFKGTTLRPNAKIVAESFEEIGAICNAFTTQEYTGYYGKGNPRHTETFLDILGDIYVNSTLPPEEIQKEKGVIVEELNMYEDMPQNKVFEELLMSLYGDQPAGRSIGGTKQTVNSFTRKDFIQYMQHHYTGANTVVIVAGSFDPVTIAKKVRKTFGVVSVGQRSVKKVTRDVKQKESIRVFHKDTDQAHVAIGFRSVPIGHKDGPAIALLATILGGTMSSRLFMLLREEMGAAYYVRAEQDAYTDHGIFTIAAGIDKTRFTEIMNAIVLTLKDLKEVPVSAAELSKVKEYTIGMMGLGLESSDSIAGFCGMQLLLKGDIKTPQQLIKEYAAVTAEDIQRLAKMLFVEKKATMAVVGPFKKESISEALFSGL